MYYVYLYEAEFDIDTVMYIYILDNTNDLNLWNIYVPMSWWRERMKIYYKNDRNLKFLLS